MLGNYIGTNAAGANLGNNHDPFSGDGVRIDATSSGNVIGGLTASAANVIGFEEDAAIAVLGSGNQVVGNYIGTNSSGTT